MPTITRSPELPPPQDPWIHASETAVHADGRQVLSDTHFQRAFADIVDRYTTPNAGLTHVSYHLGSDDVEQAAPNKSQTPRHRRTAEHDYQPTPTEVIDRRRAANKQATLALAHTLRYSHPELLEGARAAYEGPATQQIIEPETTGIPQPRPKGYTGRHRR